MMRTIIDSRRREAGVVAAAVIPLTTLTQDQTMHLPGPPA